MDLTDNNHGTMTIAELCDNFSVDANQEYSFITITLPRKSQKYQSVTQYEMTVHKVRELLFPVTNRYLLVTELTQNGNVHYHALVHFRCQLARICFCNKIKKAKALGFFDIHKEPVKTTEQIQRTITYMCKDVETTKQVIHSKHWKPEIIYLA